MFRQEAARVNCALIGSTQLVLVEGVSLPFLVNAALVNVSLINASLVNVLLVNVSLVNPSLVNASLVNTALVKETLLMSDFHFCSKVKDLLMTCVDELTAT